MKRYHVLTSLATAAFIVAALSLAGCSATHGSSGGERSYTDEQLESHDGSSYFPDTFTFEELMEDHRLTYGSEQEGAFSAGAYLVGADSSPAPGVYQLTGSDEKTGDLVVYAPADEAGQYRTKFAISYLGFTLVELDADDAVFFDPPTQADTMHAVDPLQPTGAYAAPYESGLYRVGIDVPAGTYTVTQSEQSAAALAAKAYAQPQVIVYSSLDFGTQNTMTEEDLPPLEDGPVSFAFTVEDGQYLELYGCTATPEEP